MKQARVYGLHAVQAALDYSADKIQQAWIAKHRKDQRLSEIVSALEQHGISICQVEPRKLDNLAAGKRHQGVIVAMQLPQIASENQLKAKLGENNNTGAFYLVLDHVQDPHNLGACLRTADAAGVQGIIITKDQAVGMTPTVCKVACGAAETVPVYQVTNLVRILRWLKDQGVWIIGAAGEAQQSIYQVDLTLPMALVIGAEEKGMRRLTREQCDLLVKLPMLGQVDSLNLSVAAGVMIYEVLRQRNSK